MAATRLEAAGVAARFLISGGLAAGSLVASLYVLTDLLGLWYVASAALAWGISLLVSFSLQRTWTFGARGREGAAGQLAAFVGLGFANGAINAGLMFVLVDRLGAHYLAAQVGLAVLIAAWNFAIMRYLIFPRRPAKAGPESRRRDH